MFSFTIACTKNLVDLGGTFIAFTPSSGGAVIAQLESLKARALSEKDN